MVKRTALRSSRAGVMPLPCLVKEEELGQSALRFASDDSQPSYAYLASLEICDASRIKERFGMHDARAVEEQVKRFLLGYAECLSISRRKDGSFLLLAESKPATARQSLDRLCRAIATTAFSVRNQRLNLTPAVGFAHVTPLTSIRELMARAEIAREAARAQLDLCSVAYQPEIDYREQVGHRKRFIDGLGASLRTPLFIAVTSLIGLVIPFAVYCALGPLGYELSRVTYLLVVLALLATAFLIWIEAFAALKHVDPPDPPGAPYPRASAIIAAYLPNESVTIVETIERFLTLYYPGNLQIILGYNTPHTMPIEDTLRRIARRDPRFILHRVEGSTSKAQNVNACLQLVTGEFVGVFDADHEPAPGSFSRAWRWLSNGYDVVQGHCLVRNGETSWIARLIAVEFETIYGLNHPGRTRLHGFGIFGGSNGYWKTEVLNQIRMRQSMLTEDIDSSMRALERGHRIASDPGLISRELAPPSIRGLWNQRMRWAQGWFQVSLKHTWALTRSRQLSFRQKLGAAHLLGWCQVYPWISLQIIPILAYWIWWRVNLIDWLVPVFIFTTAFTLSTGPGQSFLTYLVAQPEIRRRNVWFLIHFFGSIVFYSEFKNLIARVAQIQELFGEKQWKVTPRSADSRGSQRKPAQDQHVAAAGRTAILPASCLENAAEGFRFKADLTVNTAKRHEKQRGDSAAVDLSEQPWEQSVFEDIFRRALERGEFRLFYQPIVTLPDRRIGAAEALIRWNVNRGEVVSAHEFLPLAAKSDLILDMGTWVLETACHQVKVWNEVAAESIRVSVNLCARQIREPGFVGKVRGVLAKSRLDPQSLQVEINDDTFTEDSTLALSVLRALSILGVRTAIDGFGRRGCSLLAYLPELTLHTLKLNRCLVRDIASDPKTEALVSSITEMARSLKIDVIAEGVETYEQLTRLEACGCDQFQGYLISRPVPARELDCLLEGGQQLGILMNVFERASENQLQAGEATNTRDTESSLKRAIEDCLAKEGTTKTALARRAGISRSTLNRIIAGQRVRAETLAAVLGAVRRQSERTVPHHDLAIAI